LEEPFLHVSSDQFSDEQREAGLDWMRQAAAANPAVRSRVVRRELRGDFEWSAVYVVDDLDGYWEYLTHPAHVRSEMEGIAFLYKFEAIDVTDSDDPEISDKIAQLQARNYAEHPELAALVAQQASFTCPETRPDHVERERRSARLSRPQRPVGVQAGPAGGLLGWSWPERPASQSRRSCARSGSERSGSSSKCQ
jgi:hypothetical protein